MKDRQINNFDADLVADKTPQPTEVELQSPDSTPQPAEVSIGPEVRGSRVKGIMKWVSAAAIGAAALLGGQKMHENATGNAAENAYSTQAETSRNAESKNLAERLFTPQISLDRKKYKINVPPVPMKIQIFTFGEADPIEILTHGNSEIAGYFKKEVKTFFFKAYKEDGTEIKIVEPSKSNNPNDYIGNTKVVTEPREGEDPEIVDAEEERKRIFREGDRGEGIYL